MKGVPFVTKRCGIPRNFARILYQYHAMFTIKNSSSHHGSVYVVVVVDITLATRNEKDEYMLKEEKNKKKIKEKQKKNIRGSQWREY